MQGLSNEECRKQCVISVRTQITENSRNPYIITVSISSSPPLLGEIFPNPKWETSVKSLMLTEAPCWSPHPWRQSPPADMKPGPMRTSSQHLCSVYGLGFRAARDAKFRLLRRWDRGIKRLDVACGIIPEQNLYLILTLILGLLWPGRGDSVSRGKLVMSYMVVSKRKGTPYRPQIL